MHRHKSTIRGVSFEYKRNMLWAWATWPKRSNSPPRHECVAAVAAPGAFCFARFLSG